MTIPSLKEVVSAEEWKLRVDLAAAYRLVAAYGWSDLIFTHISARIPGPEHHFLIKLTSIVGRPRASGRVFGSAGGRRNTPSQGPRRVPKVRC